MFAFVHLHVVYEQSEIQLLPCDRRLRPAYAGVSNPACGIRRRSRPIVASTAGVSEKIQCVSLHDLTPCVKSDGMDR